MSVELTIETVTETVVLELQDHVPAVLTIDNIPELRDELDSKVDKEAGMGLSELSFTTVDKLSLDQSEQDRHTHNNKAVIDGLSDDAGVLQYKGLPISDQAALDAKVDKVTGKSLVADTEIAKLATVQENATANRDDSENADKVHDHAISDVTGLTTRLNDIDSLIGDVAVDVEAITNRVSAIEVLTSVVSSVTWDMVTDTYTGTPTVTPIHTSMRRCVINNQAQVQYYLDEFDSTKKEDGTPADLSGADGQVVVEINPTYVRRSFVGSKMTTELTHAPLPGFKLHEAFSGGVLKHYIGAYQATVWSVAGGENLSGLNLDSNLPRINLATDYLTSLPDSFAMVGVSRTNFRTLAQNGGYQLYDYWQLELLKTLFIAEFGNWNSQAVSGNGNVYSTYLASSDVQSDSPHTMNGRSNSLGNNSGSSATNPFVSYRGIENPWGNAWQWVDGVNILERQLWVSNDETLYNDNNETGYVKIGAPLPASGYIKEWQKIDNGFLPAVVGGGAGASTFIGDYLYSVAGRRALLVGGAADSSGAAGLCCMYGVATASLFIRSYSARLSKKLRAL